MEQIHSKSEPPVSDDITCRLNANSDTRVYSLSAYYEKSCDRRIEKERSSPATGLENVLNYVLLLFKFLFNLRL